MNKEDREEARKILKEVLGRELDLEIDDDELTNKQINKGLFMINFLFIVSFKICHSGYNILKFIGGKTIRWIHKDSINRTNVVNESASQFLNQSDISNNHTKNGIKTLIEKDDMVLAQQIAKGMDNKPELK